MNKIKKLRKKEKKFVHFKPEGYNRFDRMDVTKWGAFRDARKLLKEGKPSVAIYWRPERYTYFVTEKFEKDWEKKDWLKIAEINHT